MTKVRLSKALPAVSVWVVERWEKRSKHWIPCRSHVGHGAEGQAMDDITSNPEWRLRARRYIPMAVARKLSQVKKTVLAPAAKEMLPLKKDGLYLLKTGEKAIFKHIGLTGAAVFSPPGEPSFEDCFILREPASRIAKYLRQATREERGY